jgi:hypothetical protein
VIDKTNAPCAKEPKLWSSSEPEEIAEALNRCNTCPLKEPCLDDTLLAEELWGEVFNDVVGGTTKQMRLKIHMRRNTFNNY